jgi:hypothetical protein
LGLEGTVKGIEDNGSFHNLSFFFQMGIQVSLSALSFRNSFAYIVHQLLAPDYDTERKVSNTAVDCCGYWTIRPCPPPFICTNHAPGIFSAIIREFAGGEVISSVPVITKVGFVMLESLLQVPLHLPVASS